MNFEEAVDKELALLRETLIQKNKNYGNSFFTQVDEWGPAGIMIPISNKTDRLKTLYKSESQVSESIEDSHLDGAGYHLLARIYRKYRG